MVTTLHVVFTSGVSHVTVTHEQNSTGIEENDSDEYMLLGSIELHGEFQWFGAGHWDRNYIFSLL